MKESEPNPVPDGALLSAALKAIRRLRSLTARQTAARMNMSLRTYVRFESGETRLNFDYIHRFARATDSDPYAIVAAVTIASPTFAVHSADNQLALILTVGLQDLARDLGPDIAALSARDVLEAAGPMFQTLTERARTAASRSELEAGRTRLDAARPRPGR